MAESVSPPTIVLYGPAPAPYTEKVRRALMLKGLPFEVREPASPEDYRRWSPETGLLPVLSVGDERIHDSTSILVRLDQLFPEPALLSSDPTVAEQQRQLEDWADESFLWYFMKYLSLSGAEGPPQLTSAARTALDSRNERAAAPARTGPLRRLASFLRAGTWERPETALLRGISDRLGDLANFLGMRPFFYADHPSMADLAVYGMLNVLSNDTIPGSHRLLYERPSLVEFMRRLEARSESSASEAQASLSS